MTDTTPTPSTAPTRLIPVKTWPTLHHYPSAAGLRHLIFHADTNGFNACIARIGRRVLIDEAAFFAWAKAQNGATGAAR